MQSSSTSPADSEPIAFFPFESCGYTPSSQCFFLGNVGLDWRGASSWSLGRQGRPAKARR
jgi:hypothetical protein